MAGARDGKPEYLDVLVVAAALVDRRPALNLGVELAKLEAMVRRSAIPIRVRRVFPPTYAQLEKELSTPELERRRREPRVLHFLHVSERSTMRRKRGWAISGPTCSVRWLASVRASWPRPEVGRSTIRSPRSSTISASRVCWRSQR